MKIEGTHGVTSYKVFFGAAAYGELSSEIVDLPFDAATAARMSKTRVEYWKDRWPVVRAKVSKYLTEPSAAAVILFNSGDVYGRKYGAWSALFVVSPMCIDNNANAYPCIGSSMPGYSKEGLCGLPAAQDMDCLLGIKPLDLVLARQKIVKPDARVSIGGHRVNQPPPAPRSWRTAARA